MSKPPFEQLVTSHGPRVLRVCRSLLAAHDAEDAWSETFLAALRAYPELREGAHVEAWLLTIARRKSIDILRSRARQPEPSAEPLDALSDLGVWAPTDESLWAALRALPDKQRRAVGYHYLAGRPYAEVAELLGGSTDAARRAAHDGITRLRRTYATARRGGDHE